METKADVNVLMEGIRCQQDDIPSLKQALLTLASMCNTNDTIQDYVRDCEGLVLISQQLTGTSSAEIKEVALYTLACAVDKNVYSQKQLTSSGLFNFLYPIIQSRESSYKLKQTACFLLLSLVANNDSVMAHSQCQTPIRWYWYGNGNGVVPMLIRNYNLYVVSVLHRLLAFLQIFSGNCRRRWRKLQLGHGQMLLRKSNCLALLFELFKTTLPKNVGTLEYPDDVDWFDNVTPKQRLDLWTTVTSVLCVGVNNPQNDENQRVCASIFPVAFVLMQNNPVIEIVRPITSLIGLAVANNVHNQQRVLSCGGLEAIVSCMHRAVNRLHESSKYIELAVCLTNTLDAVITDNEAATIKCGELGVVPLLLQQIRSECMETSFKLNAIVTLGHCVEMCETNQKELVSLNGIPVLIGSLGDPSDNEELNQAIKYVLQACASRDKSMLHCQQAQLIKEPTDDRRRKIQQLIEEETDPKTDIRVLEKKFKELESRLTLQNPNQGLTLRELANLHTSRIPTEDSEIGTQQRSERLQIELAKEKALRCKFQLEAETARRELNWKLQEEKQFARTFDAEPSSPADVQNNSFYQKFPMRTVSSDLELADTASSKLLEEKDVQFVKPTCSVPKISRLNVKLRTFRSNKYTPRKQRSFRCSSPVRSVMSEFDTRLLNSALHNETREIEDLLSDEASSIWPDNDLNVTLSSISTEKFEQTEGTRLSDHISRDSGAGDAPMVSQKIYPAEVPRLSDHISRDSGAGDAPMVSKKFNRCPGCQPPERIGGKLLTSRTYNVVLENDRYTCDIHRSIRQLEREIAKTTVLSKNDEESDSTRRLIEKTIAQDSPQGRDVFSLPTTPLAVSSLASSSSDKISTFTMKSTGKRRQKLPFTEEEEHNLLHGVEKLGRFWTQILNTYSFHPSRTATDLKNKFRNMSHARSIEGDTPKSSRRKSQPFSMAEERRLRKGVKHFANNWSAILRTYKFQRGRTAVDLKDKWRNMTKANFHLHSQ